MKQRIRLLAYEIRSCIRQLRETFALGTLSRVALAAGLLLAGGTLGALRMMGMEVEIWLGALPVVGLLAGLLAFGRQSAAHLLQSERIRSMAFLPVSMGTLQWLKMEKLLFAGLCVYAAGMAATLGAMLLGGCRMWRNLGLAAGSMLAFCLGQRIRMVLFLRRDEWRPGGMAAAVLLVLGTGWCLKQKWDALMILRMLCRTMGRSIGPICGALAAANVLITAALMLREGGGSERREEDQMARITPRMEAWLEKCNYVVRRDLQTVLHDEKEKRRFICRAAMLPVAGLLTAVLMRLRVVPLEASPGVVLMTSALMNAASCTGLFQRFFTMGYEKNMVLYYLLSGRRISEIQLTRLRGVTGMMLPAATAMTAAAGLILGAGWQDILAGCAVAAGTYMAQSHLEAYFAIRGTSYINIMNMPRMSSRLMGQLLRSLMETGFFLLLAMAELTGGGNGMLHLWLGAGYTAVSLAVAVLMARKIRKGDGKFYGEYQSAVGSAAA